MPPETPEHPDIVFLRLKEILAGGDDSTLRSYADQYLGGTRGLLDLAFAQLPDAFLPQRSGGREIDFQFLVIDGVTHAYFARVRNGTCETGAGILNTPTTSLTMELEVFVGVLIGTLTPARAFLSKRIRVSGEMMAATKFESWFRRP